MAQSTRGDRKSPLHHDPAAVKRAREWSGMSKVDVQRATGWSLSLVSEIESGTRNCTPTKLRQLADVFNCPVSMLERKREDAA